MDPLLEGTRRLAIDAGRSRTRARARLDGRTESVDGPGIAMVTDDLSLWAAEKTITTVLDQISSLDMIDTTVLGFAGFARRGRFNSRLAAFLAERTGSRRTIVVADCITSHIGALGCRPGVVVSAGTGVVVSARSDDEWIDIGDGHGYLFGDRGGGFSLGLAGLRQAARAHDHRWKSDALLLSAESAFGPVAEWPGRLQAPDAVPAIASFARQVLALARAGDAEALAIRDAAAADLADTAEASVNKLMARIRTMPVPVSWSGSLFKDLGLRSQFLRALTRKRVVVPQPPIGSALDGADLLMENPRLLIGSNLVEIHNHDDSGALSQ